MKIINRIKQIINIALKSYRVLLLLENPKFENERISAELVRNVHSIEKGLSLRNIRPFFGYAKIIEASELANKLIDSENREYDESIMMFIHALKAYLEYHNEIKHIDNKLTSIQCIYEDLLEKIKPTFNDNILGGCLLLSAKEYSESDFTVLKQIIYGRHSVRQFSKEPVDLNDLFAAIACARYCPSACNRQGFRVHVVCKDKMSVFNDWFEGVGGFADEIDKMLLITGKISTYRAGEEFQYIVSSAVFAGYLTLTLQAKNIGCCFIQRPVLHTKKWEEVSTELGIPSDEQIICALGVGNYLPEYKVPVSHRFSVDKIVTVHGHASRSKG